MILRLHIRIKILANFQESRLQYGFKIANGLNALLNGGIHYPYMNPEWQLTLSVIVYVAVVLPRMIIF